MISNYLTYYARRWLKIGIKLTFKFAINGKKNRAIVEVHAAADSTS